MQSRFPPLLQNNATYLGCASTQVIVFARDVCNFIGWLVCNGASICQEIAPLHALIVGKKLRRSARNVYLQKQGCCICKFRMWQIHQLPIAAGAQGFLKRLGYCTLLAPLALCHFLRPLKCLGRLWHLKQQHFGTATVTSENRPIDGLESTTSCSWVDVGLPACPPQNASLPTRL